MATGRDDFVIAIRSAFLKKKDKQKFSLLTLIILSIFVIVLSNLNFKAIQFVKLGINEVIYRSSHIASIPENKLREITSKFKSHMDLYESHQKELIKIENSDQLKLQNEFLTAENEKLRELLDESINSQEIFARVLIDKDSPFLKSSLNSSWVCSIFPKSLPVPEITACISSGSNTDGILLLRSDNSNALELV